MTSRKSTVTKQQVYETIRDNILFLDLRPGTRLSDVEMAEEMSVSRTPVREALLTLQRESFVDIFPQSGTFVSLIDFDLIKEIMYMRHVLELDVLSILMRERIPVRKRVERYIYLQKLAVEDNNPRDYIKNDHLFHRTLFEMAGHGTGFNLFYDQYQHTIRFHMLDFLESDLISTSLQEHKLILDYLEQGDMEQLKGIVDIHHDCNFRTSKHLLTKYSEYFVQR